MAKYQVDYTESAVEDIVFLKTYAQRLIDTIDQQLIYDPGLETRNRKFLKNNPLATWELRIGVYRVFYDIDAVQKPYGSVLLATKSITSSTSMGRNTSYENN